MMVKDHVLSSLEVVETCKLQLTHPKNNSYRNESLLLKNIILKDELDSPKVNLRTVDDPRCHRK
jgi:hypothetical protein